MRVDLPCGTSLPLSQLDQPGHPLTLAFTLLSQAFWSRSQKAVDKAAEMLREMYLKRLITPFDVGYTFFLVHLTVDPKWMDEKETDKTTKQHLKDFQEQIAEKVFGGVPLTRDRVLSMFSATAPLDWVMRSTEGSDFPWGGFRWYVWHVHNDVVGGFLVKVIKANGITIDLFEYVLARQSLRPWSAVDMIVSVSGKVGKYVLLEQETFAEVDALARQYPDRFVRAVRGYLSEWYDHFLHLRNTNRPKNHYNFQCDEPYKALRVLAAIVPLLSDPSVSKDTKATVAELCLLIPYLVWLKGSKSRYRESVEGSILAHWQDVASKHLAELSMDSLSRYAEPGLVSTILDLWRQKVRRDLTMELRSPRLYEDEIEGLAVMLSGLVLMDPVNTGHMLNHIYNCEPVKPSRGRKRLVNIIQKTFQEWPALSQNALTHWPDISRTMNRITTRVTQSLLAKIA